jgi:hypothetical protein
VTLSDFHKRRRAKSVAIALALFGFAFLVYLITLVKLGSPAP